jgi:hypothetical protein
MIMHSSKICGKAGATLLYCAFFVLSAYGGDTASSVPPKGDNTISVSMKQDSSASGSAELVGPPEPGDSVEPAGPVPSKTGSAGPESTNVLDMSKPAVSQVTKNSRTRLFSTLVGDLPKLLSGEKGPYLITSDVYVPAGKTVTIEPGVVLLFKNFTGIHVQGTLILHGTSEKPIIFTSENDRRFNPGASLNPNPYDWNGIFIHDDAIGTDMQNFEVSYSVYGINTLTKFIRIANGIFHDNGRANLTIEGMPQTVTAGPFSYSLSVKNAAVDGVPVKILTDPDAVKRNSLRIGGVAVCLTGCAVGAIFTLQMDAAQKKMNTIKGDLYSYQSSDFTTAQTSRNSNAAAMVAGYALGLIGAAGFSLSFRY